MTLRLNGSSSGFTEIDAPAAAGSNTLTMPTSNGSANQYLANGSTAGELTFVTPPGSFTSYAIICDQKAHDANGGTFTSGAFRTRDLNTELADPDSIVSISSNQFTLGAGNYLIEASAPVYRVDRHITRLQNITDSETVTWGTAEYADASNNVANRSFLVARVSLTGSTTFELQHRADTTNSTQGFGVSSSFTGTNSIYAIVKIYKEA